ncbi:carbohydrate ABC transporter permease [Actinophytocola oryzae]|uniref:Carbohydrate ABC transporter membrane protein 2 (CUT1 family) n=1 Tax=Actinophytocola oryzae TaxID=502181 RepID=A0A4R7UU32_9PSEU|nr:carbohydrate ABC transporter permease [Actinophytocola oryzae]TDV38567.1 carbohydrate ABC transporter membrane protein 2 (CUT1 family) [Actinophytocola oryzae]
MRRSTFGAWARGVTLVVLALLWLVPAYLLVVNAMTATEDYTGTPLWLPHSFALFDNVATAWEVGGFGPSMRNSLYYAIFCAGVAVLVATLAAFAVTIMPIRRPVLWFWFVYAGTLLPLQVFARPLFLGAVAVELYDTWTVLTVVYIAICVPFAFFVVRNFLVTMPPELVEAARLDGASWSRMFASIHLPLARPAMAAAFVFQFVWVWNELFFGITLTISPQVQPVMAALARLQTDGTAASPPVLMAAALLVSVPTVVVFFAFQRFFRAGVRSNL